MGRTRAIRRSQGTPLPVLDERRCTGCELCVRVCPTECLERQHQVPWLVRPGHCISCGLCVFVCPTTALSIADE